MIPVSGRVAGIKGMTALRHLQDMPRPNIEGLL